VQTCNVVFLVYICVRVRVMQTKEQELVYMCKRVKRFFDVYFYLIIGSNLNRMGHVFNLEIHIFSGNAIVFIIDIYFFYR